MIPILYFTIFAAFIADYRDLLEASGPFGRLIPLLPEAGSFLLLVAILMKLGQSRQLLLAPKYLAVGFLITLHFSFGLILSDASSGVVVGGLRDYFRFLPLFLLPAVVYFSEKDVSRLLKFVLMLCLIQIPVSIYQWLFIFPTVPTGDVVRGTLPTGSTVSILMICAIAILASFWSRGFFCLRKLLIVSSLLMIPTLINETKATILLFGCAMISLAFLSTKGSDRILRVSLALSASVLFVIVFSAAYDYFFPDKYGGMGLISFYSERAIENEYLGIEDPSEVKEVTRIDSIVLAYKKLKKDPTKLAMGLGIGNVSHPERNTVLQGEFSDYYIEYNIDRTTYTQLLWEIGLLGIAFITVLILMTFFDSRSISHSHSFSGAFGLGWATIMLVLPLMLLYKSLIHTSAVVTLLMFFSGYFASIRFRIGNISVSNGNSTLREYKDEPRYKGSAHLDLRASLLPQGEGQSYKLPATETCKDN